MPMFSFVPRLALSPTVQFLRHDQEFLSVLQKVEYEQFSCSLRLINMKMLQYFPL